MIKALRNNIITGIFVALPIIVTIFLIAYLIRQMGEPMTKLIFLPIFESYDSTFQNTGLGKFLLDCISTVFVIIALGVVGYLSRFFFGVWAISIAEGIVKKIPVASAIYNTVKQVVDTFSKKKKSVFNKVVLVEFPRKGVYSVGFLSNEASDDVAKKIGEGYVNVFVPTTPNPTSGFLMLVPKSDMVILDMSVADGMKFIVSFGAVVPESKMQELINENAEEK